ncbi:MAG: hypothetical protein HND27_03200 [Bacteroidetes bacterium]|nr:hypothetical protein [Bacteroidota bacterium]MBV6460471.1 Ribosomal RNA large subunit methyltransferase L [Flavobacteriales bacterium]WKZ74219.1 MAG: THUMP domain-containing protein [Vicingaceae bacterium]NOG94767.1 hypothetical protein [Bacteroidota bacterium]CAG0975578.1 Ribosomal RNA large subunit methyltransferase L [Flavobacteriales bacterium]
MELVAKCNAGLESVLAKELYVLGAENIRIGRRAVLFSGNNALLYKANLYLRTAIKVLLPISEFNANSYDELYEKTRAIDWNCFFNPNLSFAIEPVVNSSIFTHSQFASLRVKDGIADYFREKKGKRPSVNPENPDFKIILTLFENRCSVGIDSSGDPLFKRGYRQMRGAAPIKEDLAAGMVLLSNYKGQFNLFDPFCGSGTIIAEAAMIACNFPPNLYREHFGFKNWSDYNPKEFLKIKKEAEEAIVPFKHFEFFASDISSSAINATSNNLAFLNKFTTINISVSDFFKNSNSLDGGILITNPPYGERLQLEESISFYKKIGDKLKSDYTGFDAWIISSNNEAMKHIGLKPSAKIQLYNGKLECSFRKYELYRGSKKQKTDS